MHACVHPLPPAHAERWRCLVSAQKLPPSPLQMELQALQLLHLLASDRIGELHVAFDRLSQEVRLEALWRREASLLPEGAAFSPNLQSRRILVALSADAKERLHSNRNAA